MTFRVLVYLDYDDQSGFGHVSRARAFIRAMAEESPHFFLSSRSNPLYSEIDIDFLSDFEWVSLEQVSLLTFDLIYVDTYDLELLKKVENLSIQFKILVIDNNFVEELPAWADMVIDLERSLPRENCFEGIYLFSEILVYPELQEIKQTRELEYARGRSNSELVAVVNFGGSVKIDPYLKNLKSVTKSIECIYFIFFVPNTLVADLRNHFSNDKNVEIRAFGTDYRRELAKCDFLITNSGTSFVEGLYMNLPMVIFNLFSNAQTNFEKYRYRKNVIYSGYATDIDSGWLSSVLDFFKHNDFPKSFPEDLTELVFVETKVLASTLRSMLSNE